MSKWIHPKTKTGDAVTGDYYLRRPKLNDRFWSFIKKGSDVLFVAPRRVGKTSIMKDLEDNAPENVYCIYRNVEGATSRQLFYKRVFEMLIIRLSNAMKAKKLFGIWVKKYGIGKIGIDGFEIERIPKDFYSDVVTLLKQISKEEITVILFIDEFVEVILNLTDRSKQEDAIDILHELREIRHNEELSNIIFVYAGSIGLHSVVNEIGRPKLINDIEPLAMGPLVKDEPAQLIKQLTKDATLRYTEEHITYLISKIEYTLPYFIQLMIAEADQIAYMEDNQQMTYDLIDRAFTNVIKNTASFSDWVKRLKDYQKGNYPFVNSILTHCAHNERLSIQEIYDLAESHDLTDIFKDKVDELVQDGYLVEEDGKYRFLSPFLKHYWLHKNPILK